MRGRWSLGSSTQDKKSPGHDVAESIDVSPSFMFCPYSRVARPKRHPLVLLLSPRSCNYVVCTLLPTPFKFCFRSVIGENFEFQDDICGVVAQPRQNKDKVAIWLTRCDSEPRLRGIGMPAHDLALHFGPSINSSLFR